MYYNTRGSFKTRRSELGWRKGREEKNMENVTRTRSFNRSTAFAPAAAPDGRDRRDSYETVRYATCLLEHRDVRRRLDRLRFFVSNGFR